MKDKPVAIKKPFGLVIVDPTRRALLAELLEVLSSSSSSSFLLSCSHAGKQNCHVLRHDEPLADTRVAGGE